MPVEHLKVSKTMTTGQYEDKAKAAEVYDHQARSNSQEITVDENLYK